MKVGVNKVKESDMARVLKKILMRELWGIKCQNFFGHFLRNCSLKVFNFLHDGRRQLGASFEYDAIFWKNPGLIRRLSRD